MSSFCFFLPQFLCPFIEPLRLTARAVLGAEAWVDWMWMGGVQGGFEAL